MRNEDFRGFLEEKLSSDNYEKLLSLPNPRLHEFVAEAIRLCKPDSVFVCTDEAEDIRYIRETAIKTGEETPLKTEGHTVHFDGYHDQARDKKNTRYLLPPGKEMGANFNTIEKREGLDEVRGFLDGGMKGKEMLVRFFCLGPTDSVFSISGVQITDSFYVAHSEDLLYRQGFEQFRKLGDSPEFFRVLHSAGELTENAVSKNVDKRRVYIDLEDEIVYSVNTQYAGNTVGFKKLALRLAINKAVREGWLSEHMFVMGVHGPGGRVTYLTGAYPSFCGKTSTAMVEGESIVGDDIAYLREIDGRARAVNVESGVFGIIRNVNAEEDPLIWKVLDSPGEVIFSNVMVADGVPYWIGDGREHPKEGINHSGKWWEGKKDEDGNEIPLAHKNARFTIRLKALDNLDERAEDPEGVELGGIIYGGRDSDTWVPVKQSFDWTHGVITMGASLESETTAATLGAEGVREFNPMSNLDFLSIPLGKYINAHLDFGKKLKRAPLIFSVNYFIKDADKKLLTGMQDKKVWLKWMDLRINGEAEAIRGPTGYLPRYDDLKKLFSAVLHKEYSRKDYEKQFKIRIPESLAKIDRIEDIYRNRVQDAPQVVFDVLEAQRERLLEARGKFGDYPTPEKFS